MKKMLAGSIAALGMIATLLFVTPANAAPSYPGSVVTSCQNSSVDSRQLRPGQYIGVNVNVTAEGMARPNGLVRISATSTNGARFVRVLPYSGRAAHYNLGRVDAGFYNVRVYFSPPDGSVFKACAFNTTVAVKRAEANSVVTSCKWSSVVSRQLVEGQYIGVRTWVRTSENDAPRGTVRVSAIAPNGNSYVRVLPYNGAGMKVLLGRVDAGFYNVKVYFSPAAGTGFAPCAFSTTVAVHRN